MIPNKTEEQILYQFFKFYDMNGQGMADWSIFIKAHEKLGVVLPRINDIEEVFNYYDKNGTGFINYKTFSKEVLNGSNAKNVQQTSSRSKNFETVLLDLFRNKGGAILFMKLLKELQIVDYNNSKRINLDDFWKISNEIGLGITSTDIQLWFQSYETFRNGIIYYDIFVKNWISRFWNTNREKMAKDFHKILISNNYSSLGEVKEMIKESSLDEGTRQELCLFIDYFKFISKAFSTNTTIKEDDIVYFTQLLGFCVDSDEELNSLLFAVCDTRSSQQQQPFNRKEDSDTRDNISFNRNQSMINHNNQSKGIQMNENTTDTASKILRDNLCLFGRSTFFNFIKHFKYYDNDTKYISKYDFVKVLKDFRLNVPLLEIEKMFNKHSDDPQKTKLNYEKFLNSLVQCSLNNDRVQIINEVYDNWQDRAHLERKTISLDFIKENYNAKNNIFNKDEDKNKWEFNDCLELFHFCYKNIKGNLILKDEFVQFYNFISFLIQNDETFTSWIRSEWDVIYRPQQTQQRKGMNIEEHPISQAGYQKTTERKTSSPQQRSNQNRNGYNTNVKNSWSSLEILTRKLKGRKVRGWLYLHRQFVQSCRDMSKITLDEFINVLQAQYLIFEEHQYQELFAKFSKDAKYLDFSAFIRWFKQELNEKRLQCVEQVYSWIDTESRDSVEIWKIRSIYNPCNEKDVVNGLISEDDKYLEFIDTFDINMNWWSGDESDGMANFEIFANYYEYVSFLFDDDDEFEKNVFGVWSS